MATESRMPKASGLAQARLASLVFCDFILHLWKTTVEAQSSGAGEHYHLYMSLAPCVLCCLNSFNLIPVIFLEMSILSLQQVLPSSAVMLLITWSA